MSRTPRGPKRSPTPTSSTFSSDMPPPPIPSSPVTPIAQKPLYLCSPFVEAALVKGNFKTIVVLPKYVDIMEWVAVNGMSISIIFSNRSKWRFSIRLLYQPQRVLWRHFGVLYAAIMSNHVCWTKVRVSLFRAHSSITYALQS